MSAIIIFGRSEPMKTKLILGVLGAVVLVSFVNIIFTNGGMHPEAAASMRAVRAPHGSAGDSVQAWKDMAPGQRKAFMKHTVLPTMRDEFQHFDATRFEKFNCKTCHGEGAEDGTFKMPNPKLYKLPGGPDGFSKMMQKDSVILKFMSRTVKPKMAAMLGEPEWTMQTKTGFGCGNCHTREMPAPAK
jgi:hypothetical protein